MTLTYFSSDSEFEEQMGYSRAVSDGDYLHVSGTTGFNYTTMNINDDVVEQTRQCIQNIENILVEANLSLADVVRVTYILPNRNDFEPCWPILRDAFAQHPPAATMLVADLYDPRMKIEIQVTARIKQV
ncbi:MAG: RidA family protein [Pseudomonadota bacterium]